MVRQENNNGQADLADLRGARFVMTSEAGKRLEEYAHKRKQERSAKLQRVK
jgi:hypothetical protein